MPESQKQSVLPLVSHPLSVVPEYHRAAAGVARELHVVPSDAVAVVYVAQVSHHEGAGEAREYRIRISLAGPVVQLRASFLGSLKRWGFALREL